jgi:hypothetical protein
MRARILFALLLVTADVAAAQTNAASCPASTSAGTINGSRQNAQRDACLMAVDVFQFLAPQLGISLTGGNATLGQGGTLGGLGHFAVGVRANLVMGDLPEVDKFPSVRTSENAPARTLDSKNQPLGLPVVDAAIGIFKGLPLGVSNVGGIDLLVNAAYVPKIGAEGDDFRIEPESELKLGFGARVGALQEGILTPGVSISFIKRDLPTTSLFGRSSNIDIDVVDATVKTTAWRIVASKSLLLFGVAAGFGQDKYDMGARVSGVAKNVPSLLGSTNEPFGPIVLDQKMTRTNYFLDLSLNLPFVKLVGEVGQVSGGTIATTNTFSSGAADDSRLFGSVGVRVGW